ncbi:hypothetical protein RR21198_3704 [Rhodococcus rhodochrous ATCC 21198]|nr:hypothetical protein RR21198_3704 [Rhodococcus rhodochrous ATCC 21198]
MRADRRGVAQKRLGLVGVVCTFRGAALEAVRQELLEGLEQKWFVSVRIQTVIDSHRECSVDDALVEEGRDDADAATEVSDVSDTAHHPRNLVDRAEFLVSAGGRGERVQLAHRADARCDRVGDLGAQPVWNDSLPTPGQHRRMGIPRGRRQIGPVQPAPVGAGRNQLARQIGSSPAIHRPVCAKASEGCEWVCDEQLTTEGRVGQEELVPAVTGEVHLRPDSACQVGDGIEPTVAADRDARLIERIAERVVEFVVFPRQLVRLEESVAVERQPGGQLPGPLRIGVEFVSADRGDPVQLEGQLLAMLVDLECGGEGRGIESAGDLAGCP